MPNGFPNQAPIAASASAAGALREFALVAAANGALLAALLIAQPATPEGARTAPLAAFAVATLIAAALLRARYPHRSVGLCNAVTHLRLTLAAPLAAWLIAPGGLSGDPAAGWAVVALAGASLALDGADGWLARREGLVSRFGARFDVEVDAALALALAALAWRSEIAGGWVLALGAPRYLFVAAGMVAPRLRGSLPERGSRKAVCALQISALIALLCPVVPTAASQPFAALAAAALAASFAADLRWLWRAAPEAPRGLGAREAR